MSQKLQEFDGERARLYEEAISKFPLARINDIKIMKKILNPKTGEKILGFGEGNGYFCKSISDSIGAQGIYFVTDPSEDQLNNLRKKFKSKNLKVLKSRIENIEFPSTKFDKVWSFGAFHHCSNKTLAMKKIYSSLKKGGVAVICDVFQGGSLAKHFDRIVSRYCITGHEVSFMSDEFAKSLSFLAGFKEANIKIVDLPQKWIFDSKKDLGEFIYKLHALALLSGTEKERFEKTYGSCEDILGIRKVGKKFYLNWNMKALVLRK